MSSTQKKVVVRSFGDHLAWGYLPQDVSTHAERVELIDPAARVTPLAAVDIKWIAYVRDFNLTDRESPERLDRRRFATRPRSEGLWVRLRFTDGDTIEGLVQVNRLLIDSIDASGGLFLTPPDPRGNTQRLFVPRTAIDVLDPLGLVLPPAPKPARKPEAEAQPTLFPPAPTR